MSLKACCAGLWLAVMAWLAPGLAQAHELSMAELDVREMAPGEFIWQWGAGEKRNPAEVLRARWPEHCREEGAALHCGAQGLSGRLAVDGIGNGFSAAVVKVAWGDGQTRAYTLTSNQGSVQLYGSADDRRSLGEIASAYTVLGIEHILTGVDHLLFVIGLLLLVGFRRQLLWTITAFTAAHSLTLASSAMGWLTLRPPPVEATIALSIVLVAAEACPPVASLWPPGGALSPLGRPGGTEALHTRQTLARRWPALVAFLFGLVHGLGFAGALKEIGLPDQHLPAALLTFNLGVEIGQLMTVAAAFGVSQLIVRLTARWPRLAQSRTALLYVIGSVAAYWSWLRVASLLP